MRWVIKNLIFVNIFSDYGLVYQTTFKTIRSDIKSWLFPKKVKIVPPPNQGGGGQINYDNDEYDEYDNDDDYFDNADDEYVVFSLSQRT